MKQETMKVNIKKLHPCAVIPTYAHDTDAGMDLTAVSRTIDEYGNVFYGFGLAFEIPKGYVGLIFPRSSIYKSNLLLTNAVGVIDSGYRGEVSAKFAARDNVISYESFWCRLKQFFTGQPQDGSRNIGINTTSETYKIGERIAQMIIVPYPKVTFEEVDELSDSERGNNGYGSSGKK
jgi:dUTP pyrophosphatase